ncbi:MAG: hypothetical protein QNJ47_23150 [Nostocaceae cyanobacterium]|nr:hypothetical protein [Nostocaceae cyanobacterium]
MKTQMFFSLATCVTLLSCLSLPVIAETVPPQTGITSTETIPNHTDSTADETVPSSTQGANNQTVPSQASVNLPQNIIIPKNTAIIVSFPAPMTVDITEKQDFPLTVLLANVIKDAQGNVIVPENSPVSIILKATDGGVKIVAQSLVVNGRVVPIKASSPKIPGTTVTHKEGHEKASESGSVWGEIGENAFGFASGGKTEHSQRGLMLGRTLGLVTGLSSKEKSRVVKISENTLYVLSLEATVHLSSNTSSYVTPLSTK